MHSFLLIFDSFRGFREATSRKIKSKKEKQKKQKEKEH